jgi:integrase
VPQDLLSLFHGLAAISRSTDPTIAGRLMARGDSRGLSVRQRIVQKTGLHSGVLKRISPTNLRNTYAHCRSLAGHNIRAVQETMGHRSIKTTLRYQACILPNVSSPLDPESKNTTIRQMNILRGRFTMTLSSLQSIKPQGP